MFLAIIGTVKTASSYLYAMIVTTFYIVGGHMISVGIRELKAKLSGYVDKVRHGEEIVVTDRGKEIARVIPISRERNAVKRLVESGRAAWSGGKPEGIKGIRVKGKQVSKTVLEERS
jgi:prevent-host-death family protein